MPHSSIANAMQPSDATPSTISSAGCPTDAIARWIAARSFTTPDAVSIWTTRMALISRAVSAARRCAIAAGSPARRGSSFKTAFTTDDIIVGYEPVQLLGKVFIFIGSPFRCHLLGHLRFQLEFDRQ